MSYGLKIEPSFYAPHRSVIAAPDVSAAGNLILRVGREHGQGWSVTEHVVMTPDEARDFLATCEAALRQ